MSVPEEIIARIRDGLDIEDVVGEVVPLKRSGAYLFGLCPFHAEKSPSFSVQPSRGRYHCFGCGADGDAIEFVRETRGLGFIEAIETLAQQAGVKLPEKREMSSCEKDYLQRVSAMRTVLEDVQSRYHQALLSRLERSTQSSSSEPQDPLAAYCAKRGLTIDVVRRFGLGWADAGATTALLKGRESIGVSAGVLFDRNDDRGDDGRAGGRAGGHVAPRWRERLRDRLTFPIADDQGRVIAFGGRIIASSADAPKYLNTPETDLYKKSEALYRIHDARASIHKSRRVIVVEGYMDAIALAGAGIQNVVACCGTAMTEHHLKKLLKCSDEVVMLFDGDQAGAKASAKAAKMCLQYFQAGKHFRFVRTPNGVDPDDLMRVKGVDAVHQLIDESEELSEYLLSSTARRHRNLRSIEDKSAFLRDMREQVRESGLPDNAFTSLLFKQAYRMAYQQPRQQLSRQQLSSAGLPGKMASGVKSSGDWRDRWKLAAGNQVGGFGLGGSNRSIRTGGLIATHGGSSASRTGPLGVNSSGRRQFWSDLLDAIGGAPVAAASLAKDLFPLLDLTNSDESKVYEALQAAQKQQSSQSAAARRPDGYACSDDKRGLDNRLSADFLASSPQLIVKKRRDELIESLGALRERGGITEAEYLESIMKVIDAS